MNYMLLLYDDESFDQMSEAERNAVFAEHMAFSEALQKAGAMVGGEPLTPSRTARTLRPGGQVEDGPYADTREQLGGFYILSARTPEEAMEWARRCPTSKHGVIEVRAVQPMGG